MSALSIDSVKAHHAGTFTCVAENSAGTAAYSANLHVNVSPQISHFAFEEDTASSGELVSTICSIHKGDLPMKITWYLNNRTVENIPGILVSMVVAPQISHFDSGEDSVNSGDSISFKCSIHKGDLPIDINWFLNNKSAEHVDGVVMFRAGQKNSMLSIDSVQDYHSGTYTCIARNKAGEASYSAELFVNGNTICKQIENISSVDHYHRLKKYVPVAPQISHFDSGEDKINSGESISLTCSVHKGDLPIEINWLLNNKSVDDMNGVVIFKAGKKISTLSIDSIQAYHAGTYTCIARNKVGAAFYSTDLHVNVAPQLSHFEFGEESVNSGDSVSLNCNAHKGDLPIKFSWMLNNRTVDGTPGIVTMNMGRKISTLSIDPVQDNHAGRYTCLAVNKAGVASYSAELHVNGTLKCNIDVCHDSPSLSQSYTSFPFHYSSPWITFISFETYSLKFIKVLPHVAPFDAGEDSINFGDPVSLTCNVHKGDTPINIKWYLNNKTLHDSSELSISKAGKRTSTLSIDSVKDQHAGTYTCVAQNRAGSSFYSTDLHLNVPPHVAPFDTGEDSINFGDPVSLMCNVHKGDTPLDIKWYLNNKTLHDSSDLSINKAGKRTSTLSIDSVKDQHAGTYTCVAQNRAGSSSYSTDLHVNGIRCIFNHENI
ncbi:hypothetical protein HHI36_009356 [Cryptolaemus montrouzieri]|uniref:Ig-like domain-containing protein n=1 Tax=Cryptolaemus montrouzieri TaxID=559131 RepID=A0ABD2MVV0_9CUCU